MSDRVRVSVATATDRVYSLCVKNRWCTSASNMSYEKMFRLVKEGRSLHDIALAIWLTSSELVPFSDIYGQLETALTVRRLEEE